MSRCGGLALGVLVAVTAQLTITGTAGAVIGPAQPLDGPSPDVLELGGVALADDGTGGLVYRKRENGRAHIFAVRFSHGQWGTPQRVDAGQAFDSSWPRIAAAAGGRLVVVWVQELGPDSDRLYSAQQAPGATTFQPPLSVDANVGEATATWPSVAMSPGGAAYVVYRVITGTPQDDPTVPQGYVRGDVRLARFTGPRWGLLGKINRDPDTPLRAPTADNAPRVAVEPGGNAIVAWQEPDERFVDRVWARRAFGNTGVGVPLPVSPLTIDDQPLIAGADAFTLAEADFGQGAIAFRQQPDPDGKLGAPRIYVNTIPANFSNEAKEFSGARLVDGGPPPAAPGVPDVSILGDGTFRVAFGVADATALVAGGNRSLSPPERLDDGTSTAPGDPKVTVGRGGGAVTAWKVSRGNATGVVTREDPSGGRPSQVASLAGTVGGGIADLDVAGSGLGDALVAFRAGSGTNGQIAAAAVDAPPSSFNVNTPIGFVRPIRAEIGWDAAPDAFGGVTYSVVIDGQVRATGLAGTSYRPPIDGLSDGTYPVYVIATDAAGQQTASTHGDLQVDGTPPTATVTARKRTAIVRVRDGTARQSAGVATARTRVFWGDGKSTKADRTSQRHRYKRRGRYRVVVKTADTAGNRARIGNTARVR